MQFGMLQDLQKWIFHCTKPHECLDKDNATWFALPADHDLTPKNMSYEEISQLNGKEMKEMSRYLPGVVTQSLQGGNHDLCPTFNRAIECPQPL
jgi:hypothetical protein